MRTAIFLFTLGGMMLAGSAMAETKLACVSTSVQLTAALSSLASADGNSDANDIRIRTGTYDAPASGFTASVTNHHNLTIRGGYLDAACEQQTPDPSMTVLNGNPAAGVLAIDTIFIPNSDIEVSGLTFQNGSSNVGGLKIGDPGPISGGKILVERNIFRNNTGQVIGGLLAATDGTPLIVRNNLFVGNVSPDSAAAFFYSNNEIDVSNNTFAGNHSTDGSLLARVTMGYVTGVGMKLSNNIFWGNAPGAGVFDVNLSPVFNGFAGATLVNNDIQASTGTAVSATDTLKLDPVFVGNSDFRLSPLSPLIDAGVSDPAGGLASVDLDGAPRLDGPAVDLGAYESSYVFVDGFE